MDNKELLQDWRHITKKAYSLDKIDAFLLFNQLMKECISRNQRSTVYRAFDYIFTKNN